VKETKVILAKDGVFGLYRGLNMTLVVRDMKGIAPFIGIKMSVFDSLKFHFLKDSNDKNFSTKNFVCGGLAGAIATAITYPTDLLRRKMQLIVKFK
jgi:hypothetical protein